MKDNFGNTINATRPNYDNDENVKESDDVKVIVGSSIAGSDVVVISIGFFKLNWRRRNVPKSIEPESQTVSCNQSTDNDIDPSPFMSPFLTMTPYDGRDLDLPPLVLRRGATSISDSPFLLPGPMMPLGNAPVTPALPPYEEKQSEQYGSLIPLLYPKQSILGNMMVTRFIIQLFCIKVMS